MNRPKFLDVEGVALRGPVESLESSGASETMVDPPANEDTLF